MGTNYYLDRFDSTGEYFDTLHIGKSSAGWVFALRVHPDLGIYSLDDWIALFSRDNESIKDEYNRYVDRMDMFREICLRPPFFYVDQKESNDPFAWYDKKIGLYRLKPGSPGFYAKGQGTWDLHIGEFS